MCLGGTRFESRPCKPSVQAEVFRHQLQANADTDRLLRNLYTFTIQNHLSISYFHILIDPLLFFYTFRIVHYLPWM